MDSDSSDSVFRPTVTSAEARSIMRDMGLRYKKVQHIAMTANSERSLVLR